VIALDQPFSAISMTDFSGCNQVIDSNIEYSLVCCLAVLFEYSSWRNIDWLMVATETAMSRQQRQRGQWATAAKATTAMCDSNGR
jgi:hypothetical protein